ncbi:BCD family MFS transporter [Limnohabitans sp. 103DPR2]|jgi:BCD family chlorophyll transporter-like MFS transporter|uniref:BCD family MFS transporter n=1 Tax=Limnohabitans sp. 103DPR2 TaxID=1678129 RepID=UPI0006DCDE31|nr:BCD family MFS transporter [Limnohabitans sp. 103DPR2]ALK91411.1 PUCC protein [Limnohabitans sp. 103DPR2]
MNSPVFGWFQIIRLGLIQACLGAVVVVTTSTLNRIMVVELAFPALLPGALVAWHYAVQMVRPRMGYGADKGRRSTPWMMGGMMVLGVGGVMAAVSTIWMATEPAMGIGLAVLSFSLIGLGVSACGTSLLTLMAKQVPDQKRAQAATTVWLMMIMGFAITAGVVGKLIDPYTPEVLLKVSASLSLLTTCITVLCLWRLESASAVLAPENKASAADFKQTFKEVWSEPKARTFTIFVFLSMLAYSAQDLILEPFAGAIHGMSPGKTTQLSGWHHMGVLIGMLSVAAASSRWVAGRLGSVQAWMVGGCVFSAVATVGLSSSALINMTEAWPLKANVIFLGVANGAFSIAAIATMMRLAGEGGPGREGTRMGLWGAAQAAAFGLGGLVGTGASDLAHALLQDSRSAYVAVFAFQSLMFLASAVVAMRMRAGDVKPSEMSLDNSVLLKGGSAS